MDVAVLGQVWRAWAERVAGLSDGQWDARTRLAGWTVLDLVAHMAPDERVVEFLCAPQVSDPAVTSGAEMLRRFNAPGGTAHTMADELAEMARRAAKVGPRALVRSFAENSPIILDVLQAAPSDSGLPHPSFGSVSIAAVAETAVVEGTVHLLDLIDAVGGAPPPADALAMATRILSAVPAPAAFIEAVTGRDGRGVLPIMR